jgi:predicted dehydrogenase
MREDSEGSRFAGEGGHFIDTVSWLLDDEPASVFACATPGQSDLQVVMRYRDGSTAVVTYATKGSPSFGKETLDLLADGKVLRLDDFQRVAVHGRRQWCRPRFPRGRDKGQRAQVDAFIAAVRFGRPMPIALESLVVTTRATLAVSASLAANAPVAVAPSTPGGSLEHDPAAEPEQVGVTPTNAMPR